jgi:predicted nucleotidyltransferase
MAGVDFIALLRTLTQDEVEFIVVGDMSAVLQGAPFIAWDCDVICRGSGENVERARSLVRLKVLTCIGQQLTYEDLIADTDELEIAEFRVRVLQLAKLIELKEELARDTDLAMLPVLRATLEEKRRLK